MRKILLTTGLFVAFLFFSTHGTAAGYAHYGNLEEAARHKADKKWKEVLSYKYAKGKLLIIQENGKTLDLKDGVYEFDNGEQYVVKDGVVVDQEQPKSDKPKKDKDDKKDKLKKDLKF